MLDELLGFAMRVASRRARWNRVLMERDFSITRLGDSNYERIRPTEIMEIS